MAAFIVFEGGDGAGKSTQALALLQRLRRRGIPARRVREPGSTPLGESLRRILKTQRDLSPTTELFLFSAARAQLVRQAIRPALAAGLTVIGDRFTASTMAYQGYGRGLDLELVRRLNLAATNGLAPDLTILLDLPVEAALARRTGPGDGPGDVFEAAPLDFRRRVREGYLHQTSQTPERWLVLDATQPKRTLTRQVWEKVQPLL